MELYRTHWGQNSDNAAIEHYTLTNDQGIRAGITNYGAIITSVQTPDRHGVMGEIVLGFDTLEPYLSDYYINNCPYFGAVVGRYANRIANGHFALDGTEWQLAANNLGHALHGGIRGFDKQHWRAKPFTNKGHVGVELSYLSPHLEEGYPGNVLVKTTYSLNNFNELHISFEATTDQPTVLNLTNHTYFNLGSCRENVLNHSLRINSHHLIESKDLIPTGRIIDIRESTDDFSQGKRIGDHIAPLPIGYDCGYVLDNNGSQLTEAALLADQASGRTVRLFTTEPSLQLYTGFFIPEISGHQNSKYGRFAGVALEAQHYPDAPNHPHFPSTVLRPDQVYRSQTVYCFGHTND